MSSFESLVQRVKLHQERSKQWYEERNKLKTELSKLTGKSAAQMMCQKELEEQIMQLQKLLGIQAAPPAAPSNVSITAKHGQKDVSAIAVESKKTITAAPSSAEKDTEDAAPYKYKLRNTLNIHLDAVRSLAFYQNQPVLVSASDDGTIRVVNIDPKPAAKPTKRKTKTKVKRNPVNIASLRGHGSPVVSMKTFLKDGVQMMLSGDLDGNVAVWEMPIIGCALFDTHGVVTHHRRDFFNIHKDAIWGIDVMNDKAITASADGTLKIWAIDNGKLEETIQTSGKPTLLSVVDGSKFVVSNDNNMIQLFDEKKEIGRVQLVSRASSLTSINESKIAIGCEDNQIRIISIPNMEIIKEFTAHEQAVTGLSITPCGKFIISTSNDKHVKAWRISNYQMEFDEQMHKEKYGEGIICCSSNTNLCSKQLFATGGADGSIHVFVQV